MGAATAGRQRLVKALALAFRWRKTLDEGVHATLEDLARAKSVHATYVSRHAAADVCRAGGRRGNSDGRQPAELQLDDLRSGCRKPSPESWTFPSAQIWISLSILHLKGSMAEVRAQPLYSYRDDPAVPQFDDGGPIAIMDGDCALCARGARAIAKFDRERRFRIGQTQSALGAALVRHYGLEPEAPETWLYLEDGHAWSGMEAILRIGARLGGPGRLVEILRVVPHPAREWLYRRIAHNRYLFGRTDMCHLPDPELRARLLEPGPVP